MLGLLWTMKRELDRLEREADEGNSFRDIKRCHRDLSKVYEKMDSTFKLGFVNKKE